jgi:response regulator RpfG family c-di-GMP phosphodiesterase
VQLACHLREGKKGMKKKSHMTREYDRIEGMEQEVDPSGLVKIKITHLVKFAASFAGIEVHVYVSGKYIRMNYANDQFVEILRKLQQKELEEVYIKQEDCRRVLTEIQNSMSAKSFYDPKTSDEQRMETAEQSVEVVKNLITQMGVDKQTVDILKAVNQKTISMLNESPSIFMFINRFRKNCSEEFLRSVLTGYLTSLVIEKFPWKSIPVKEKAALASLLCDITLNKEDFGILREYEASGSPLPDSIRIHPQEVARLLSQKKDVVPSETITIIEQHHELPDGTGFPNGIDLSRFNQLSSIFIVCQRFTEALFNARFDYNLRHDIIQDLQKTYKGRTFDKAMDALISVVN